MLLPRAQWRVRAAHFSACITIGPVMLCAREDAVGMRLPAVHDAAGDVSVGAHWKVEVVV